MSDEKVISENELHTNPALSMMVEKDSELNTF